MGNVKGAERIMCTFIYIPHMCTHISSPQPVVRNAIVAIQPTCERSKLDILLPSQNQHAPHDRRRGDAPIFNSTSPATVAKPSEPNARKEPLYDYTLDHQNMRILLIAAAEPVQEQNHQTAKVEGGTNYLSRSCPQPTPALPPTPFLQHQSLPLSGPSSSHAFRNSTENTTSNSRARGLLVLPLTARACLLSLRVGHAGRVETHSKLGLCAGG
ncbi:hypothetical protein EJ02DRAFT_53779 [Clathrospora elynae]|uniref:Uncharacterized protein n=1 Tax=Clathrospora elynae TaxID=706981 RepID=A0A6A5SY80_9PLEO|nr:hypothetical protein EJ02DRAFT_53779 [Clathrospora elynae]